MKQGKRGAPPMATEFDSFRAFYPYYLSEHRTAACRRLHFAGSWLVVLTIIAMLITAQWWLAVLLPIWGYGCAWIGHFVFERNRPATFRHPFYSLLGDWVMFADILTGRRKL